MTFNKGYSKSLIYERRKNHVKNLKKFEFRKTLFYKLHLIRHIVCNCFITENHELELRAIKTMKLDKYIRVVCYLVLEWILGDKEAKRTIRYFKEKSSSNRKRQKRVGKRKIWNAGNNWWRVLSYLSSSERNKN